MNFSKFPVEKLIDTSIPCDCGKSHNVGLKYVKVGKGVIGSVIDALNKVGVKKPFIVTDKNEYEACGKQVEEILKAEGIPLKTHIIPEKDGKRIAPSEYATGSIALNFDSSCDGILCVGSGVMNDLCKVISNLTGKPSVVVGTAPSMDGYASDGAAMEVNNVKLSLKEKVPAALVCDVNVMAKAPMRMLHAGLGDMMGKFSALSEWKIAKIINDEYYCQETANLVTVSLDKIVKGSAGVIDRNPDSIEAIAEGLILSGIAMAFAGTSRPASGLEHYFSHAWEMMALSKGKECDLHGIQVGIGTLLVLKIYEYIKTLKPTMERVIEHAKNFNEKAWEDNIKRVFSDTADDIIAMEKRAKKNETSGRVKRAEKIINNWDKILKIAEETPPSKTIEDIMRNAGMPLKPEDIGISKREVIDAFICSRDIRDKYLLSSMIWDIGYMEDCAKWLETVL